MSMKLKKPLYGSVAEEEKVENRFASDNQNTVEDNTAQQKATTGRTNNTGVKTSSVGTTATASSGFVPSADVLQAKSLLQQWQTNRPGNYTPIWQDEADAYLSQYQNRDPFSYDFNSDAPYQQLRDNYIQQGELASMNTMGQAAAMTGGYGNSYAQSAGQQAYNMYLNQLNDVIPELYQMASDRYNQEGQNMLNMYDLYMNRENYEYGKYQDDLSNWYQEYSRLQDAYDTQYNREYNEYRDNVSDAQWAKSFNKSSGSSGNGGRTYKDINVGDTVYKTLSNEVEDATTIAQLQNIVQKYISLGYDPDQIDALTSGKANLLMNKNIYLEDAKNIASNVGNVVRNRLGVLLGNGSR